MKKINNLKTLVLQLFAVLLILAIGNEVNGQTNPALHNLSVSNYTFTEWAADSDAGTYPANMRFWRTGSQDPTLSATASADWAGAYNLGSGPRINGLGADGFSFINTGSSGNLGMAVVGLNATGRENIQVSWTGGTVAANPRQYAIRLQYRIGTGAWTDVPGPIEYSSSTAGHSQSFGPTTLPSGVNNQSEVYLRWFYYYVGPTTGARPQLRVDDITITSVAAGGPPVASINVSSNFTPFVYALNDGPPNEQSYTVAGINLDNDIVLTVPTNFEHALDAAGPYQTTNLTLSPVSGTVNATEIFVRLVPGLEGGSYSGSITVTSDDPSSPSTVSVSGEVLSETLPYLETFGTTAGVFPLGWTTSGPGAANWTIGTSTPSTQDSAGGSGGANLQDAGTIANQEAIITVNRAISTVGFDDVLVTFLARRTSAYTGNVELDYSINGTDWFNVPFADVANNAAWAPVAVLLPPSAAGVDNLRLRLRTTRTNTSGNYRIDDFTITSPSRFVYQSGELHELTSWEDADELNPTDFTSSNQLFIFNGTTDVSTTSAWTVSGANSRIIVGNGTNTATLTISENFPITGIVQVEANSILNLNDSTLPTLSSLNEESTVVYGMNGNATIQSLAYGNLTVTGSGTKTFPSSTIAVNGNLLFEDVTLAFAGTNSRIDYSRNITLTGTISYSGVLRPEFRATANNNVQVINTGAATLEVFNFYAQNKTGGSLILAGGSANISALNNLRLNFPAGVTFNDGGNTIIFGDDLRVQGDAASYTLNGTLRLEAASGTNDFENIDVPLNNLEIVATGSADPQFAEGSNTKDITIEGNLLIELEDNDLVMNDVTLNIGGNFTFNTSGEGVLNRGTSVIIFNGSAAQSFSTNQIADLHNVTVNKSSGALTVEDGSTMRVNNLLTIQEGIFNNEGSVRIASDAYFINTTSNGPTLTFERTLSDHSRWVALSTPVSGNFAGAGGLLDGLATQGFPGSQFPDATPNVLLYNEEGAGSDFDRFVAPASNVMPPHRGFMVYLYERTDVDDPDTAIDYPVTLSITGGTNVFFGGNYSWSLSFTPGTGNGNGWHLLSNPFGAPFDWNHIDMDKSITNDFAYIWDPVAGQYLATGDDSLIETGVLANSRIPSFQAFFVKANEAGLLTMGVNTLSTEATPHLNNVSENFIVSLQLDAAGMTSNTVLRFNEVFSNGVDARDAYYLVPMSDSFAMLYTIADGEALMINSMNAELTEITHVPLSTGAYLETQAVNGEATLTWPVLRNLPDGWEISLHDTETGTMINLLDASSYTFELGASTLADVSPKALRQNGTPVMNATKMDTRFELVINPGIASSNPATPELPVVVSLEQNYPNPFNPSTQIRYELPQSADVRLDVFNIQGQRVATLVNQTQHAGVHTLTFDASALSSGVYVYRLQTGNTVLTRKMTLIK